ncbi:MAG: agmatine deiminase family protein [Myxococcota bacterium]
MKRALLSVLGLVVATAGCETVPPDAGAGEPTTGSTAGETAAEAPGADEEAAPPVRLRRDRERGVDYIFYPDEPMRHAYRDPSAKPALKADEYDDIRWAHPERYAITAPPPEGVRPMVEWEPMKALMMAVPAYMMGYDNASHTIIQIVKHTVPVAEVWIVTDTENGASVITDRLLEAGVAQGDIDAKVKFLVEPIDSVWVIDSGPLPLVDEEAGTFAFTDFRYYHNRALDDGLPTWLGRQLPALGQEAPISTYRMPLNTEGGTFQATSDGVCFTGNRQLYYMSCDDGACDQDLRTMPLDEVQDHPLAQEVRDVWTEYAGCEDVVITNGITDDGTGHIDMYLKIVDDDTIIIGDYREPYQEGFEEVQATNAARMDANAAFLESYVKPGGGGFEVERVVMPGHRTTSDGGVPFTYINSTFVNGLNLWPAYAFEEDDPQREAWEASREVAQGEWEAAMPDYEHIWIDSEELSYWSGAIHCITRTIPDQAPEPWVEDGACGEGDSCEAPEGGYDGQCKPNDTIEDVCWGPAWLCTCNDCETGCTYEPGVDPCNGVTYTGCCDEATLRYCEEGSLVEQSCPGSCGWDGDKDFYDCGFDGADPSGANPLSCGEVACTPDCDGRVCGDDGCGGSCGECDAGEGCTETGQCEATCEDACTDGDKGCDGETAWVCAVGTSGCTERYETDCVSKSKVCTGGLCVTSASDDTGGGSPDAGSPDASSGDVPQGDASGGEDASGADGTAGGGTGGADGTAGGGTGGAGGGGSDGCQASEAGGSWPVFAGLLALLAVALRRRIA